MFVRGDDEDGDRRRIDSSQAALKGVRVDGVQILTPIRPVRTPARSRLVRRVRGQWRQGDRDPCPERQNMVAMKLLHEVIGGLTKEVTLGVTIS
jgi:hypothetical protein